MTSNKSFIALVAGAAMAASAIGQQPPPAVVGATAQVQGLVTVSFGATVANVANESPVIDGSRYVTSSTGRAELRFKDGCVVKLEPNQWTFVDASTDCDRRNLAVYFLNDSSAVAGLGGGSGVRPFLTGAALLLGAAAAGGSGGAGGTTPEGGNIPLPITPPPPMSEGRKSDRAGLAGPVAVFGAAFLLMAAGLSGTDRYLALIGFEVIGLVLMFALALRRAIFRPSVLPEQRMPVALWFVLLSPLLFAVLQLTPIPESIWAATPGRAIYTESLKGIDVAASGWRSLSISPDATRASLLAAIPLAALFLVGFLASIRQVRLLLRVVVFAAFAQVALGLLQISGGEHSHFFFGVTSSFGAPIGTMGNRNLYANYLAMALSAYLWLAYDAVRYNMRLQPGAPLRTGTFDNRHAIAAWVAGGLVLVLGVLMSKSRGAALFGLTMAFVGLGIAGLRVFGWSRGWRFALPITVAVIATVGWLVGLDNVASRVTAEQLSSSAGYRAELARTSLEGAWAFFPWGSGWGTFAMAYQRFQPDRIAGYANHAHMDYIQMLLEGGLAFLVVGGCMAWLFARRAVVLLLSAFQKRTLSREAMTATLCGLGLLGFLLHALVDFNMRILPNALLASLLAGVYLRPLPTEEPED